jgi:hypothetical protein
MKTLIKFLVMITVLLVLVILLTLLAVGFVKVFIWVAGFMNFQHSLGIDTQMSKNYDSVSGYLPMIVTALGFSGVLITIYHHLECHVQAPKNCHRLGHPVPGTPHRACHEHNPATTFPIEEKITAKHLKTAHNILNDY